MIEGGYVYVDKTKQLLPLINEETGQYFLSRPRRFGKSLLISTLEAIFSGRRELFKGLYIDGRDNGKDRYNWKKYPVIKLDMGSVQATSPEILNLQLELRCRSVATKYGISLDDLSDKAPASEFFLKLVEKLVGQSETGKVVILVDEYDKPLLNHLGKHEAIPYRDILKAFYSVIKTTEEFQRFAFITGVSKFTRVSIFSDLNNLTELTMDARAATLLGYTHEEVNKYFADRLPLLANAIEAEVDTNIGCIDAVAVTDKFVYVFEFKLDKSAKAAMKQIHEKKYYERYLNSGKKIMLVGAAFSQKTRNIGKHLVEEISN